MKRQTWMVLVVSMGFLLVGAGCQDWQKKYKTCQAELDNLQSLFDNAQQSLQQCEAERNRLVEERSQAAPAAKSRPKVNKDDMFPGEKAKWDEAKGTITVTIESGVLFDSGKSALKNDAKKRLARIADTIKSKYAGKEISVVGHTDTDPIKKSKWQDNWELSTERSLAVTRHLISQGVSAKHLIAAGRGEHKPVGSSKAANRRVEIVVHMYD